MALSQKHPGKIFVPWYNSYEWRYVYSLIYSENSTKSDKQKAVEILQIWKIRMPLIFGGLEGTLIILKAMLHDENVFSKEELCSYYGLAIMRFLNLCAAHSDQQGNLFRVAKKKNLPDWLVNIRHDLAHSQKLPSLFMLRKGLEYCFHWLKREYWEMQDEKIKDFIIPERTIENIEDKINSYCEFIIARITQQKFSPSVLQMLKEVKGNKNSNSKDVLKQLVNDDKYIIEKLPNLMIQNGCLFNIPIAEDTNKILRPYIEGWEPTIQFLHENKILIKFVKKLHDICINNNDSKIQKLSSLWLFEIFNSLHVNKSYATQDEHYECDSSYVMNLQNPSEKFLLQLNAFAEEAMETPHIYLQNYFSSLMKLCGYTKNFIEDMDNFLCEYFHPHSSLTSVDSNPITIEDINEIIGINTSEEFNNVSEEIKPNVNKRWIRIEDTEIYKNCPIGILPHQDRNYNPTITF